MDDDQFLTRAEAAALMHLAPRTLGNLAAMKPPQGPRYMKTARLRGKTLYRRSEVIAFMEANGGGHSKPNDTITAPAQRQPKSRRKATSKS